MKKKKTLHKSKAHKQTPFFSLGLAFESMCICIWRHECVSEYLAVVFVSGVPAGERCVPAQHWLRSLDKGLAGRDYMKEKGKRGEKWIKRKCLG